METNYEEDDFDDDIPAHRRITVTRVSDHAELADSVLSAQSAPTIHLTPMSPPAYRQNMVKIEPVPHQTRVKLEQH